MRPDDDGLGPARGCLWGLVLGLLFWAVAISIVAGIVFLVLDLVPD